MVQFPQFRVERWMDTYETKAKYDLAETCALSIQLKELIELSCTLDGEPKLEDSQLFQQKLGYGHIQGSPRLRERIAKNVYSSPKVSSENILITQGAIGANFLSILGLVQQGDEVIVVAPSYQQLQDLPRTFGANVQLWQLNPEDGWNHDITELKRLITNKTSLIIINNPNNPTGSIISNQTLLQIHSLMKQNASSECMILCDEVYSPLWHSLSKEDEKPSSLLDLVEDSNDVLVTGSLSKAYSLAGVRVGWIATQNKKLLERLTGIRDYNVISVSMLDDELAARALGTKTRQAILHRNIRLARTNRKILQEWIEETPGVHWIPTKAGNTAMVYLGNGIDDEQFCSSLCLTKSVNVVPAGLCFGHEGYVRIGYVGVTEQLIEGLKLMTQHLSEWKNTNK